jgi:hypothetical protein
MCHTLVALFVPKVYGICQAMASNPAQIQKKITFRLPLVELERLEEESRRTGRTKTDILREFIRTLPRSPEPESKPEEK